MDDEKAGSGSQPSCSRCGRAPDVVAARPGQTVFDILLGICPACTLAFCTDCAASDAGGYSCPVHRNELELI